MDPSYATAYPDLAAHHWWWQARESLLLDEIRRLRAWKEPARILDIGCGDGRLFPVLGEFGTVEGIEPDAITLGTTPPPGRRIHHTAFALPLPVSGKFDLILMLDVLEHLDDPVASLRLAGSLLSEGGTLLATVPALPALWTRHDALNHHRLRYTKAELGRQLEAAGLSPEMIRYEFHALALAKLAVRAFEAAVPGPPGVPRPLPPALNRAAVGFIRAESWLCRPVARLLPGSSLLALASLSSTPT